MRNSKRAEESAAFAGHSLEPRLRSRLDRSRTLVTCIGAGSGGLGRIGSGNGVCCARSREAVKVNTSMSSLGVSELEIGPGLGATDKRTIIWLRNELRVHDNPALSYAAQESESLLVVYIFDRRIYRDTGNGNDGALRGSFLVESIYDVRKSIRDLGSDLLLFEGEPESLLPHICRSTGSTQVVFHQAVHKQSIEIQKRLIERLEKEGIAHKQFWSNTMYQLEDTPFNLRTIPWEYEQFEKELKAEAILREPIGAPKFLPKPPISDYQSVEVPSWVRTEKPKSTRRRPKNKLCGGEREAIKRIDEQLRTEAFTPQTSSGERQGDPEWKPGWDIGLWLEEGCISPRWLKSRLKAVSGHLPPERLQTVETELVLWDFYQFISLVRAIMSIESHLPKERKSIIA